MRWEVIKQAWRMAKVQFPNIQSLYVQVPVVLAHKGYVPIFDLTDAKTPIGAIDYQVVSKGSGRNVRLALGADSAEVRLAPSVLQSFKIAVRDEPLANTPNPNLVRARYGEEAEEKLALLGLTYTKTAKKPSKKFEDYERVRICGLPAVPEGMEHIPNAGALQYQEAGQVMTSARGRNGRFYLILVDGSSEPQWFHEEMVCPILAGEPPDASR